MRHIILLLILLSCGTAKMIPVAPVSRGVVYNPSVVTWKSKGHEYGVTSYRIQRSRNGKTAWANLVPTVLPKNFPDSNIYTFQLPKTGVSYFYRIYITTKGKPYVSDSLYLINTNLK